MEWIKLVIRTGEQMISVVEIKDLNNKYKEKYNTSDTTRKITDYFAEVMHNYLNNKETVKDKPIQEIIEEALIKIFGADVLNDVTVEVKDINVGDIR